MSAPLHIFPTLECNGHCPFCAIRPKGLNDEVFRRDRHVGPERWAEYLSTRKPEALYITGGEPMLYKYLEVLVNAVSCPTWIYTNGTVKMGRFLLRVDNRKNLRVRLSFHPHLGFSTAVDAARALSEAGVEFSLHAVQTSPLVKTWVHRFAAMGFSLLLDPDFVKIPEWTGGGKVRCHLPNVIVGPDAMVYPCTSKMVRATGALYRLDDKRTITIDDEHECEEPAFCSACDLAFLKRVEHE